MAQILDGKVVREKAATFLKKEIEEIGKELTLAIVQVGSREDSNRYIHAKKQFASQVGVKVLHVVLNENVETAEILSKVENLNNDTNVHGIIIQLPLPSKIDKDIVINAIHPTKDIDGLGRVSLQKLWADSEDKIVPATTRGILSLLDYYSIDLSGKRVTIIGRSDLVGKPTAIMCMHANATITVCHSKTEHLEEIAQQADILIVAIGKPEFINKSFVREGQVVIDVGINSKDYGKLDDEMLLPSLVGDVDYNEVKDVVKAITPVPGGVGQMTVVSLFQNLVDVYKRHQL